MKCVKYKSFETAIRKSEKMHPCVKQASGDFPWFNAFMNRRKSSLLNVEAKKDLRYLITWKLKIVVTNKQPNTSPKIRFRYWISLVLAICTDWVSLKQICSGMNALTYKQACSIYYTVNRNKLITQNAFRSKSEIVYQICKHR